MVRRIVWFSCGAASAVTASLVCGEHPEAQLVYCETNAEHEDNKRFMADVVRWLNRPVTVIKSNKFHDTWAVWDNRKALAFKDGAPCTLELKLKPRLAFQRPTDIQYFGYTADKRDAARADRFRERFFEVDMRTPLIDAGLTKANCLAVLERQGIKPPLTYALGLPNANCIPCPKATSPNYWALIRKEWPEEFDRIAKKGRKLGVRLTRIPALSDREDSRIFIDQIPADWPCTEAIAPSCDFMCAIASEDIEDAHYARDTVNQKATNDTSGGKGD